MKIVKKVVIPAAGLGTRFFPITKSVPKEMIPIIDTPTIQIIIEEAIRAGIEEVIIVNSRSKPSLEHYFHADESLNKELLEKGKQDLVDQLSSIEKMAKITFVYQDNPKGLGHAILCAKEAVGNEPFAVMLGDDVVVNGTNLPAIAQLIKCYQETMCSVVGVQTVELNDVSKYGIIKPKSTSGRTSIVEDMVEKPAVKDAPSRKAILGCYVLTPRIFELLETQAAGKGNEIQLTDAIKRLIPIEGVCAYDFEGKRYDVGDKLGYVTFTLDRALQNDAYHDTLIKHLKKILEREERVNE